MPSLECPVADSDGEGEDALGTADLQFQYPSRFLYLLSRDWAPPAPEPGSAASAGAGGGLRAPPQGAMDIPRRALEIPRQGKGRDPVAIGRSALWTTSPPRRSW